MAVSSRKSREASKVSLQGGWRLVGVEKGCYKLLRELRRLDLLEKYGPSAETLSDEQLELLELEPGVSTAEIEAESQSPTTSMIVSQYRALPVFCLCWLPRRTYGCHKRAAVTPGSSCRRRSNRLAPPYLIPSLR